MASSGLFSPAEVAIFFALDYISGRREASRKGVEMKIHLTFAARLLTLAIATATIASCGGGGGGGGGASGPTPTLALTAANAQNVGGDVLLAAVQAPGKSNVFLPASAGFAEPSPARKALVLSRFVQEQVERVRPMAVGPLAGVVQTQTVQCAVSGNIVTVSDGNSATETFNAC